MKAMPQDHFWLSRAPAGTFYQPIDGINSVGYNHAVSTQYWQTPPLLDHRVDRVEFYGGMLGRHYQNRLRRTTHTLEDGAAMLWDPYDFTRY
jgi:hypothetical protein